MINSARLVHEDARKTQRTVDMEGTTDGTESERIRKWIAAEETQFRLDDDAPIAPTVKWNMLRGLRDEAFQSEQGEVEGHKSTTGGTRNGNCRRK